MPTDQPREQSLLFARESLHVGVLEQIRAVPVVTIVRDVEPDLVKPRGPLQYQVRQRILELPRLASLREELEHTRLDALGLREVDVIALLHAAHAALTRVLVGEAAHHV